jgi:hypothetical protein
VQRVPGRCWIWPGHRTRRGYGRFQLRIEPGVTLDIVVHRIVWLMTNGPISSGLRVVHRCAQRSCINPEHLVLEEPCAVIRKLLDAGRLRRLTAQNVGRPRSAPGPPATTQETGMRASSETLKVGLE